MKSISQETFYGRKFHEENLGKETKKSKFTQVQVKESRQMPLHINGPPQIWRELFKQNEALALAAERKEKYNDSLCTFVYENKEGHRRFVVAHPEVYWFYYKEHPPEKRCSYEVIPEGAPCWLYLDLEFMINLNPQSDGARMTSTLIDVFCAYLLDIWQLPCSVSHVVNLDSTTTKKFSRHLIFSIKDVAFKDNFHVGRLVNLISKDIITYLSTPNTQHKILNYFNRANLEELVVQKNNGKNLFIDTGVYSRNRHFRIYKSTKWGKQSYLLMSKDCKYVPFDLQKDKELSFFLNSLISFFPNKKNLLLLEYVDKHVGKATNLNRNTIQRVHSVNNDTRSQYPHLDKYIQDMVHPGKIRAIVQNTSNGNHIVYEIIGNRYCENIKRPHKSNHIYWVVDINKKFLYQKCHDEDCRYFKSLPKLLPEEINFQLDDEIDKDLCHLE